MIFFDIQLFPISPGSMPLGIHLTAIDTNKNRKASKLKFDLESMVNLELIGHAEHFGILSSPFPFF